MIYPIFPKKDSIIGIFPPSAGVGHKIESFNKSIDSIKSKGYSILETESVRVNDIRPASGMKRAEEFHQLLKDDSVKAIISASGGEFCIEMLPFVDANIIKKNPKWLCGYSDPTNLEYFITTKLDISTIYGFNAGGFDWSPLHEFQVNQLAVLGGNVIVQNSYDYYDSDRSYNKTEFKLDTAVSWDLYMPGSDSPVLKLTDFSGRIIGGCTEVISRLIGTPYDGTQEFISKYQDDGFIWYFDTFESSPIELYCTMLQFKYAGMFKNAKAIIMGRVMYPNDAQDYEYVNLLKMVFEDIPFIWGADIGHTKPSMTIINGSIAKLRCYDSKAILEMILV